MRLCSIPYANHPAFRYASSGIDTILLIAAILLTLILGQFPFVNAWLTVKLALLVLYIVLGSFALKRAKTQGGRALAFVGALATFAWIVGVAVTRNPQGWLGLLPH